MLTGSGKAVAGAYSSLADFAGSRCITLYPIFLIKSDSIYELVDFSGSSPDMCIVMQSISSIRFIVI